MKRSCRVQGGRSTRRHVTYIDGHLDAVGWRTVHHSVPHVQTIRGGLRPLGAGQLGHRRRDVDVLHELSARLAACGGGKETTGDEAHTAHTTFEESRLPDRARHTAHATQRTPVVPCKRQLRLRPTGLHMGSREAAHFAASKRPVRRDRHSEGADTVFRDAIGHATAARPRRRQYESHVRREDGRATARARVL
jgi:hypothetical protein